MDQGFTPQIQRESFAAGDFIFHEGEFAHCAYIVEAGRVEVLKDAMGGPIRINSFGKGELFGEMALIGATDRTATVKAIEETTLLVVNADTLTRKIEAADPVVQRLVKVLIARLREQTKAHAEDVGTVRMG